MNEKWLLNPAVRKSFVGGSPTARGNLEHNASQSNARAFFDSAKDSNTIVDLTLQSLPELLKTRFQPGSAEYQKALNIEAYIEGYSGHSCMTGSPVPGTSLLFRRFSS